MHKSVLLFILIFLTACSSGATAPTGTPNEPPPTVASPAATTVPATVVPPAASASEPPARPAEPLPAPLYTLDQGQIFRIERDGLTRTRLTEETVEISGFPPIATFAVSNAGRLAYVVGDLEADRLVITGPDGADAAIRYSEVNHELSDLAWTPDGSALVVRLLNNRQPPDIPSGIYRLDPAGGDPELLVADDPVDNLVNPAPEVAAYRPFAWSPDGATLLVEVYSPFYFTCGLGFLAATGGSVTRIELPADAETYCGEASWAPDGARVLFMAGPESGPTIWQATLDGAALPLTPELALARAPLALADGTLRLIAVEFDAAGNPQFSMAALPSPDATPQPLRPASADLPSLWLWGPQGSGAAALLESPENQISLRWLPADGGAEISLPATRTGVTELRWGGA